MKSPEIKNTLVLFILSFAICSLNIGGNTIYILDEAKNATCALEMMQRNDWVVPTFNGELRTDKPPLHYFMMLISYRVFGVNEFAARFFSAFFGAVTIIITFLFSLKYLGKATANRVAMILLCSLHFTLQFHLAVPDPYLICFITAALICFYLFFDRGNKVYLFAFYAFLGLGTLTKGPVAIILPGLGVILFLIYSRRLTWTFIVSMQPAIGITVLAIITLPWYLLVHYQTEGAWTEGFFLRHNVGRFTKTMEGHGGIFLLTPLFVLIGLLPFSVFVFQAFRLTWTERKKDMLVFCLSVVVVVVLFFSVSSTKLPNYVVPCYPFLAVLLGYYLNQTIAGNIVISRWPLWIYLVLMLCVPAGVYIALESETYLSHLSGLAYYFILLPIGALLALWYACHGETAKTYYALFLSFLALNILFFTVIFPKADRENPVFAAKELLKKEGLPIAYYKRINPSFVFYLKRPVQPLDSQEELKDYLRSHQNALIISRARYLDEIYPAGDFEMLLKTRDLFEEHRTILIREIE